MIIKAKVYQAINLALLGYTKKSKKMFKICKREAQIEQGWSNILDFVEAGEEWLIAENIRAKEMQQLQNNTTASV